jgi:O-antigen ligase
MNILALVILGAALGYAAFQRAAVGVGDCNTCLIGVGVAGVLYFLAPRRDPVPAMDRFATALAGIFVCLIAVQLVPFPVAVVKAVSPMRVELLQATLRILGGPGKFVTLTAAPYETAGYLIKVCAYLLIILVIRDITIRISDNPWLTIWPVLIVAASEAVLGIYQAYAENGEGFATGTYANRDHYAGLLEIALPFAVMHAIAILHRGRNRHESPAGPAVKACGALSVATVILVAAVLSLSRMGFLASLAGLFVAASLTVSLRAWRGSAERQETPRWRKWLPSLLVATVIILGFIFLPTDPLVQRFSELARTDEISADARAQIWRDTVSLVRDYPIFGCGMGTYDPCFLRYKTVAPMNTVNYAHNDYLQVVAEFGFVGFGVGLVFMLRVVQQVLRGIFAISSVDERYLSIGCLASITAILLHSFVDFNMYIPANAIAFSWVIGIAAVHLVRPYRKRRPATVTPSQQHQPAGA